MLKKATKQLICGLLYKSHLLHLFISVQRFLHGSHPLVLYYHRVLDPAQDNGFDCSHQAMVVKTDTFRKQIAFLKKWYHVISLDEYLQLEMVPKNVCIITFDDGWIDNYTRAFPILVKYECPATIYLSTNFIGGNDVFWQQKFIYQLALIQQRGELDKFIHSNKCPSLLRDILNEDREISFSSGGLVVDELIESLMAVEDGQRKQITQDVEMYLVEYGESIPERRWVLNWDEIREMAQEGISFGSHTQDHKILTRIPLSEATEEIIESKKVLEHELVTDILSFAFPNGNFNEELLRTIEQAGYRCALTTEAGRTERLSQCIALRRVGVHEGMSTTVNGIFSESLFACSIAEIFSCFRKAN